MTFVRRLLTGIAVAGLFSIAINGTAGAVTPDALQGCMGLKGSITKPDGSILAVGTSNTKCGLWPSSPEVGRLTVIQVKPDGSPDASFSDGGVKMFPSLGVYPRRPLPSVGDKALLVLPDRLIRLNDDGSLDEAFGDGGTLMLVDGSLRSAETQPDHKILVATASKLTRYESNGQIDDSFGVNGSAEIPAEDFSVGSGMALDAAGNTVLAGYSATAIRFDPDGNLDLGFGGNGNGVATAPPPEVMGGGVSRVFVGKNGTIRLYGTGTCWSLYCDINFVSVLDSAGLPVPASSGFLPGGGYAFAEDSDEDFAVTWGPTRGSRPAFLVTSPGSSAGSDPVTTGFKPAPGEALAFGIDYAAQNDSFVAVGRTAIQDCGFCDPTAMVVAKVKAKTNKPDLDFGNGGVVVLPRPDCAYGDGAPEPGSQTAVRCKVRRPVMKTRLRFTQGGGKRPGLLGTAEFGAADKRPVFVGRRLTVKLPNRVKLSRKARSLVFARVLKGDGSPEVSLKGRRITFEFQPSADNFDPFYDTPPTDNPPKFEFGLRRGALKPVKRKIRRKRLVFNVRATQFPTDIYEPSSSRYYAPNSTTKVLRVRPVTGKVPRAGR